MVDPNISILRHNSPRPPMTGKFVITANGFVIRTTENAIGEVTYIDDHYVILIDDYDDALIEKVRRCFNLTKCEVEIRHNKLR